MVQDFRNEQAVGISTTIQGVSGLQDSKVGDDLIQISMDPAYYPVDMRSASGNIVPNTSGAYDIGGPTKYWEAIYVDNIHIGSGRAFLTTSNIRNGYGISGIYIGTDGNIYITTSGFLQESGLGVSRRHAYPYDAMTIAGTTLKNNGVYTVVASGTAANPNDDLRMCSQYSSAATFRATATIGILVTQVIRPQDSPSLFFDVRAIESGAGLINAGLLNMNVGNSGLASITGDSRVQGVWLHGGSGLSSWRFITKNTAGATVSTVPATIAPQDSRWYDVQIWTPDKGTTWLLQMNGNVLVAHTGNVPASGANLGAMLQIANTSPVINRIRTSYFNLRVNNPNPTEFFY